jgi:hypothetical protein
MMSKVQETMLAMRHDFRSWSAAIGGAGGPDRGERQLARVDERACLLLSQRSGRRGVRHCSLPSCALSSMLAEAVSRRSCRIHYPSLLLHVVLLSLVPAQSL